MIEIPLQSGSPVASDRAIRKEALHSAMINGGISAAIFLALFGSKDPLPIWGRGGLAIDTIVQAFMIAIMATVVPVAIMRRKRRTSQIPVSPEASALPRSLVTRALLLGLVAAGLSAVLVLPVLTWTGIATAGWYQAITAKIAFGALTGAAATAAALRAELAT